MGDSGKYGLTGGSRLKSKQEHPGMSGQTKTLTKIEKATFKFTGGKKLPTDLEDFHQYWEYIQLRGDQDLSPIEISKELGVSRQAVYNWDKHRPFQEAILPKWRARAVANTTLASLVTCRILHELEIRTRSEKMEDMPMEIMLSIQRTLKEQHGVNINIGLGAGVEAGSAGSSPRALEQLYLREVKEANRLTASFSTSGTVGQGIADVSDKSAVPASTPLGVPRN